MKKADVLDRLRSERVIALVSADVGEHLTECAQALSAGGINTLELVMTTPAALGLLERAAAALPEFHFGLGTVLDVETAQNAIAAGASFIVTPSLRPAVITLCRRYNVPVISGVFSGEELAAAQAAGADAAKIFPGELFGPAYLRQLKQAHPAMEMIPVGGVAPSTIAEFLRVGALAGIAGNSLVSEETLTRGDWTAVTEQARRFCAAIGEFAV